ncbi:MAG: hypothetical protein Q4D19_03885 [Lautropia sp.]|nr:hypothetical protein [Lautropia sp.]
MSETPQQNKTPDPMEIRISMRVYLNLVVAYSLVSFVINATADGLGEPSYASASMALAIVFGGCYLRFLSLRGEEVAMPLSFIVLIVLLGVVLAFKVRAIISFMLGTF